MKASGREWIREASWVKEKERQRAEGGGRLQFNGYGTIVILPFSRSPWPDRANGFINTCALRLAIADNVTSILAASRRNRLRTSEPSGAGKRREMSRSGSMVRQGANMQHEKLRGCLRTGKLISNRYAAHT